MPERRRPDRLIALFVAVLWAATAFALDGMIALAIDRDAVPVGIGPYYGVIAFVLSGVAYWAILAGTLRAARPWTGAVGAGAAVYLLFLLAAAPWGFALMVTQALSPFVLTGVAAAVAIVVASWAVLRVPAR